MALYRYKLRAEFAEDFSLLQRLLPGATFEVRKADALLPDVEVVIETDMPVQDLKEIIALIPDHHVMMETLNVESLYTGKRTYKQGPTRTN